MIFQYTRHVQYTRCLQLLYYDRHSYVLMVRKRKRRQIPDLIAESLFDCYILCFYHRYSEYCLN